jgi:hypothetical protein
MTVRQVETEFKKLVEHGAEIISAGEVGKDPSRLLSMGYTPKHKFQLFDATYYLTNVRYDENFRFFVAYVLLEESRGRARRTKAIHPRIFYKDSSLVWRSPTHYIRSEEDNWIGKGGLKCILEDGVETEYSAEETTNLPLEIQSALDVISRKVGRVRRDDRAVGLVLRRAPNGRFDPYRDFTSPRRRAMSDRRNLINNNEYVAYFLRENDPGSLRFVSGFEPDFAKGLVEVSISGSRLYGGEVRKFRILSKNRVIQYHFIAAPRQAWIIPPQALTTEIMSYGVRTIDVDAAEDLFVPGYEYHFIDETEDPPLLYSQIPEGFAGEASEVDGSRADASRWIEALPVIQEFRRMIPLPR